MNMWKNKDTCYYRLNILDYEDIYLFDFDDTIVKLQTSELLNNNVKVVLENIGKNGNIVVFSNQNGIEKSHTTHKIIQSYMDIVSEKINAPISFFYAISDDKYRKPMRGMYDLFNELVPNKNLKYYCGDACGRLGDFSISDLYFSNNVGLICKTPEVVFSDDYKERKILDEKFKNLYKDDIWKGGKLDNPRDITEIADISNIDFNETEKWLIMMVGPSACGKSTLSKHLLDKFNFKIINGDTLKTKNKQIRKFNEYYNNPKTKGIIIDNTNAKLETRKDWLNYNKKKWKVVIIFFDISKDLSFHCSRYRTNFGGMKISSVVIHTYYKYLVKPTLDEGEIITIDKIISNNFNQTLRFVWR